MKTILKRSVYFKNLFLFVICWNLGMGYAYGLDWDKFKGWWHRNFDGRSEYLGAHWSDYNGYELAIAAQEGHTDYVAYLLKRGYNPNERNSAFYVQWIREDIENTNYVIDGESPLNIALLKGHSEIAIMLLNAGANPNTKTEKLDRLEDHYLPKNVKQHLGETPLHLAVKSKLISSSVISRLLNAGANPNAKNDRGETPLHIAVEKRGPGLEIEVLLEAGANLNTRDSKGKTPEDRLEDHYHLPENVRQHIRDIFRRVARGDTPISYVRVLYTGDPNATNDRGETPLHLAVEQGNLTAIKALLDVGANPNAKDHEDKTPVDRLEDNSLLYSQYARIKDMFREAEKLNNLLKRAGVPMSRWASVPMSRSNCQLAFN